MQDWQLLGNPPELVAPRLLGAVLERELNGQIIRVRIVETEAYHQSDAASHSYRGRTPRTDVMFGPAGHLYVYFTYGMHYCMNVVTGPEGEGSAVLIRATEPLQGEELMIDNRGGRSGVELTNGPAKVCQALQVDKALNGHELRHAPLKLILNKPLPADAIHHTTRIGITKAVDMPWRFYIESNAYVSRP